VVLSRRSDEVGSGVNLMDLKMRDDERAYINFNVIERTMDRRNVSWMKIIEKSRRRCSSWMGFSKDGDA
jgi:hypothetical protein